MNHAQYSRYVRDNHVRLVLGTEPVGWIWAFAGMTWPMNV